LPSTGDFSIFRRLRNIDDLPDAQGGEMPFIYRLFVASLIISVAFGAVQAADRSRGILLDIPQDKIEEELGILPATTLSKQDRINMSNYRFTGDTLKVLVIPVEWDNRPATYSREVIDSLVFSRNVFPGGSVADYYDEVSYGQLAVIGTVLDWQNAGTYYGDYYFEPLFDALDAQVDYTQFDGDYDGNVDAAVFVRSGTGEEDSQDPWDIWSYAYVYQMGEGPGPFDGGMHIPRWNTSPEMRPLRETFCPMPFSGEDTLNRIRVFCHELAHNVGLPDLYDYDSKLDMSTYDTPDDYNDHPLMDWCLMGYYGYGLFALGSEVPAHFCGWSKKSLGWIDPLLLNGGTHEDLVLRNIETTNDSSLYMIPIDLYEGEYFLLEYRNPGSTAQYDKLDSDFSVYLCPDLAFGCDTLDRGLLITHVHDSLVQTFRINNGWPEYPHYSVAVEDAGYNPSMDAWSNPEGHVTDSAQWWYPYETRRAAPFNPDVTGQEEFGPATYPSSDGYSAPTDIVVRVDSIVDDRLYAYVNLPAFASMGASPEGFYYPFHTSPGVLAETSFTAINGGNIQTEYEVAVEYTDGPGGWLTVLPTDGVLKPGSDSAQTFSLQAVGPTEEAYCHANVNISYDDHRKGPQTLVVGVDLYNFIDFYTPEDVRIRTDSNRLNVSQVRIAHNDYGSKATYFNSPGGAVDMLYDGSLVISTGPDDNNYMIFFEDSYHPAEAPANKLLYALSATDYDSTTYVNPDLSGYRYATGKGTTHDSTIAFTVEYFAPSHPDSAGFYIMHYVAYGGPSLSGESSEFHVGFIADFDVPDDWGGVSNESGYDASRNLIYQQGQPDGSPIGSDTRYAGLAYFGDYNGGAGEFNPGGVTIDNSEWIWQTGNFVQSDLHDLLATQSGWDLNDPTSDYTDLTTILVIGQGMSIAPGDTIDFIVILALSNDGQVKSLADLQQTVDKGRAFALAHVVEGDMFVCGDADASIDVDIDDVVYLINYIFSGGPEPVPYESGDADCSFDVDIDDVVYLIAYIFSGGNAPCDVDGDGEPDC
jgi:M6 family metalloprotease-like protein